MKRMWARGPLVISKQNLYTTVAVSNCSWDSGIAWHGGRVPQPHWLASYQPSDAEAESDGRPRLLRDFTEFSRLPRRSHGRFVSKTSDEFRTSVKWACDPGVTPEI